ncbi:hypothetical protein SDJN02_23483, partial [Cucurbita argyrosperma subsp. argyrosperma]
MGAHCREDKREETASVGFNECNLEAGKWPAGVSFSCSKNRERLREKRWKGRILEAKKQNIKKEAMYIAEH